MKRTAQATTPCLPGTAAITTAKLAQRKINQPLVARVEQKPCDIGLFSDERDQLDLITLTKGNG